MACSGEKLALGIGKWSHDDCVAVHGLLQSGLLADEEAAAGERGKHCFPEHTPLWIPATSLPGTTVLRAVLVVGASANPQAIMKAQI